MSLPGTGPIPRQGLLAAGYTDAEVRAQLRAGHLLAVRPGSYLPVAARPDGSEAWHAAAVHATITDLGAGSVASQASARCCTGCRCGGCRWIACRSPGRVGPATTRAALEEALLRARGRPGCPAARRAVTFADGRAESVGESRSRVAVWWAGIPVPVPQQPLVTGDGHRIGRVDFWWPGQRVVGEFDGSVSYGRLLRPGPTAGDAVLAEKRREDLIRAEDVRFVRWGWSELAPFDAVAGGCGTPSDSAEPRTDRPQRDPLARPTPVAAAAVPLAQRRSAPAAGAWPAQPARALRHRTCAAPPERCATGLVLRYRANAVVPDCAASAGRSRDHRPRPRPARLAAPACAVVRARAAYVRRVERLPGGVAVVALDGLDPIGLAEPYLEAALALARTARGVVLDLRDNGGGDSVTVVRVARCWPWSRGRPRSPRGRRWPSTCSGCAGGGRGGGVA